MIILQEIDISNDKVRSVILMIILYNENFGSF